MDWESPSDLDDVSLSQLSLGHRLRLLFLPPRTLIENLFKFENVLCLHFNVSVQAWILSIFVCV